MQNAKSLYYVIVIYTQEKKVMNCPFTSDHVDFQMRQVYYYIIVVQGSGARPPPLLCPAKISVTISLFKRQVTPSFSGLLFLFAYH